MFKKALTLICTAALCLSLVGCGSGSAGSGGCNRYKPTTDILSLDGSDRVVSSQWGRWRE